MRNDLKIKLYADGADLAMIEKMASYDWIQGLTTNPTLIRKAGTSDYKAFALDCLKVTQNKPISFEVFADDDEGMVEQALEIASWGENIYIKIPVTNTKGISTSRVIKELSDKGAKLNVTAVFTLEQVQEIMNALNANVPAVISIFAGRIADTGVDPMPLMKEAKQMMKSRPHLELLWASPREVLNVVQANSVGCDIITATSDILGRLNLLGKDLTEFSLETVQMFYNDAKEAGFKIASVRGMTMEKLLITGGAGYVGTLLVPQLLEDGHEVTVYDTQYFGCHLKPHEKLTIIKDDIRNKDAFAKACQGIDIVFHLACISNDPSFELDEALSKSINYDYFEDLVTTAKSCRR